MIVRLVILAVAVSTVACSAGIGDSCSVNSDCGTDRICDTSQPSGYCTSANCMRLGCPSDAQCVEYADQVSYCMQRCGPFAFCRPDFTCVEGVKSPDGTKTYAPFCSQVASSPDAVFPADDGLGAPDVPGSDTSVADASTGG